MANPPPKKIGAFIDDQRATSVESLWKAATNHESLRTSGLGILPFLKKIMHLIVCKKMPYKPLKIDIILDREVLQKVK